MSALSNEIIQDTIQKINNIQIGDKTNEQLVTEIYSIIDQNIAVEAQVASPHASHYFFYSGGDTVGTNGINRGATYAVTHPHILPA